MSSESHSLEQTTQNSVYHEGLNDVTLYTLICPKTIPTQFVYKIKFLKLTEIIQTCDLTLFRLHKTVLLKPLYNSICKNYFLYDADLLLL